MVSLGEQDVFAFLPLCGTGCRKAKRIIYIEGRRSLIAPTNSNAAEFSFRGIIRSFLKANAATREINQVNPVNLVRKHFPFISIGAFPNRDPRGYRLFRGRL